MANETRLFHIIFPLVVTIHNLEEALFLPEWSKNAGKFYPNVTRRQFHFAVAILTFGCYVISILSFRNGSESIWANLFYGYVLAMTLNVVVPHLIATIVMKKYAPGLATALLFNLPVGLVILIRLPDIGFVSVRIYDLIVQIGFIFALLLSIPILLKLGKMFDKI